MILKLSIDQLNYLKNNIVSHQIQNELSKARIIPPSDKFQVKINAAQCSELDNELSDLFCKFGLQENDEPNQIGLFIEEIIDLYQSYS